MKQPTAPTLYPELSSEDSMPQQNYRLQKISEMEKRVKKRERCKKDFV